MMTLKPDADEPARWRVIFTDTGRETGIGPVCPQQAEPGGLHDNVHAKRMTAVDITEHRLPAFDDSGVYDCCPGPHLQVWAEKCAGDLRDTLNALYVEVCD